MAANKKNRLEKKIILQLVSVFTAVALWFIISYTENPTITIELKKIKIDYRGLDKLEEKGLTIPRSDKTPAFSVSVNGKYSSLLSVANKVKAYVNVSDINEAGSYTLDIKTDIPSASVSIISQKLKTLDVTVEPVITREVPVLVRQTDKNKEYIVKSTPQQDSVSLTGPESLLNDVSCVMVAVNTIDMKSDNMQKYNYRIMDSSNGEVDNKNSFKADTPSVFVYNELYKPRLMGIDINIPDSVSSMYDIDIIQPPTVQAGVRDGAPERLTAQFPENAITSPGAGDYTVTIDSADGVYVESENTQQKVRVSVTKKELRYVQIPVRIKNAPKNMDVRCDTRSIDTYISCAPSKLDLASLEAYADASGLGAGTHEVALTFALPKGVSITGEYKTMVTLTEK